MPVVRNAALRNLDAINTRDAIDGGSAAGKIVLKSGATTIATLTLNDPCGTVSGSTLTFSITPLPATTAVATGSINSAEFQDSNNNVVLTVSVTATGGGGDLTMGSTSVVTGDPIQLGATSYNAAN